MKTNYRLLLIAGILACLLLTGCNSKDAADNAAADNVPEPAAADVQEPAPAADNTGDIDVDLTVLSSTMVYGEVYNMLTRPEDYLGKVVKMRGQYYAGYYDATDKYYHYVVIADATACCQQGIEFIWNGDHTYPDDYPADYTEVEVVGVFGAYEELGQSYCYLATDAITVVD